MQKTINPEVLSTQLGLNSYEYKLIKERLGREPNELEVYLFSAQWSEHCGYKHSKTLIKTLPITIEDENAGYVKIDDTAIVFKVESHNHPSAVEPYQGAATGIGGIVRDVLAMGARPIALLDSLRFGPLTDPKSKHLFEGVVSGISGYGNSIGVPTVAGETSFDETYSTNPLINVMCVGTAKEDELTSSKSAQHNKLFAYVGSKTGRDGIHGASFASKELSGEDERSSVQVGDPFSEKNLIEATLEIAALQGVLACQDMGAAGFLSSSSEMADKGNLGCILNLENVPVREENMQPWEIMLSESQERMLFLIEPGWEAEVERIAKKYFLDFAIVGKTTYEKKMKLYMNEKELCNVPIKLLVNAPQLYVKSEVPGYFYVHRARKYPEITTNSRRILLDLLKHPNITNKKWVFEQYDYKVGTNTVITPGKADASVLWIKGNHKGIAVTIDGNGLYTFLDPYEGSRNIVYEAARNLIAVGAKPLGITDNMNFGNPENSTVRWQFEQSIKGIGSACRELETPVTGGNVSFYNESETEAIYPTPVIGMVGEVSDLKKTMTMDFKFPSDKVYLVGKTIMNKEFIGGSLYLKMNGFIGGTIDRVRTLFELGLHKVILNLIDKNLVNMVHDVSDGGLAVAIAESCITGNLGFNGKIGESIEEYFGENQSRFIVSVPAEKTNLFEELVTEMKMEFTELGTVMPFEYGYNAGFGSIHLNELKDSYYNTLQKIMED
ncbi:phosphoribosylformylglycinamidine synthase subunit PurL [Tepiditoga spiralis]|uniref:Phosphoribosylformylglycinamidine synthase subunit PurL n=1 Tax=Tepiditoga spiralis TaxID=2108365 RepID=A0A7G1G530_9BACT|nr:phosphoribosylformylglycinamidine synthase subunit PurL [Tepiditoga spiralis]BBE31215.1 phosphoribosylformylglycinamidine synthase subunit PurL [Tepiditoga spiralis]